MSAFADSDNILNEIEMKDLGLFTAYKNKSVKAKFNDRTIIRLMSDCEIIRILNCRGDELLFNIQHPNQSLFNEYGQYIKLTQEFLEYAFMSE